MSNLTKYLKDKKRRKQDLSRPINMSKEKAFEGMQRINAEFGIAGKIIDEMDNDKKILNMIDEFNLKDK